ncbi:trehalose 6-phosphate synthase/phosphatase [Nematocida displodere]|uniref:Trehalose 6-phosphate synthase/phosphatase n=1 Tax=Nematocida displodere TaxID=1805483 RepID=A0A177EL22_9MICR|nr:trehalose 6-phosphate synthase/phosphatase [Nematocida displodere]
MEKERTVVVSGTLPVHCHGRGEGVFAPSHSSVAASILYGTPEDRQEHTIFVGLATPEGMESFTTMQESKFTFHCVTTEKKPGELVYSKHISRTCHASLGRSALYPDDLDEAYQDYCAFNEAFCEEIVKIYEANDTVIITGKHLLMLPLLLRERVPFARIVTLFLPPFPPYEVFSCIPHSKDLVMSLLSSDRLEFQTNEYTKNFISTAFSLVNAQYKELHQEALEQIRGDPSNMPVEPKPEQKKPTFAKQLLADKEKDLISKLTMSYPTSVLDVTGDENSAFSSSRSSAPTAQQNSNQVKEYLEDIMPGLAMTKKKTEINPNIHVVYAEGLRCMVGTTCLNAPKRFIASIKGTEEYKAALKAILAQKEDKKLVLLIETTRKIGSPLMNLQGVSLYLQQHPDTKVEFIRCIIYGESSGLSNTELSGLTEQVSAKFPGHLQTIIFPDVLTYFALLGAADACIAGSPSDAFSLALNECAAINSSCAIIAPYSSGISFPEMTCTLNCPYIVSETVYNVLYPDSSGERFSSTLNHSAPSLANEQALADTSLWIESMHMLLRAKETSSSVSVSPHHLETPQNSQNLKTSKTSAPTTPKFAGGQVLASTCKRISRKQSESIGNAYATAASRLIMLDYDGTLTDIVSNPADAKPTKEILLLLKQLSEDPKNRLFLATGRGREEAEAWFGELNIPIYAEHGAYIREHNQWTGVPCDLTWMPDAIKVIKEHVRFTPGSHIEVKNTCVVFHCGEEGRWCANALMKVIGSRARVVTGRGIIEVRPLGIDKGYCIMKEHRSEEFTLCAGDDLTDEDMFMALLGVPSVCTICVGERSTCALFRADTPTTFRHLLSTLSTNPNPNPTTTHIPSLTLSPTPSSTQSPSSPPQSPTSPV